MKLCPKCGESKPATPTFWHRAKNNGPAGLCGWCKACSKVADAARAKKRCPLESKARNMMFKYGLTPDDYEEMLGLQDYRCIICTDFFTLKNRPNIDHNHTTGKVRGLLCNQCNRGIGHLDESIENLARAITYLEAHRAVS